MMTDMKGNLLARTFAEILFEMGRLQTIVWLLLFSHVIFFWCWRQNISKRRWSVFWFVGFLVGSAFVFIISGLFEQIMDGVGYSDAHLYDGMWTDGEALVNMISRWQNLLLPIYLPWLATWLLGILYIAKRSDLPIIT